MVFGDFTLAQRRTGIQAVLQWGGAGMAVDGEDRQTRPLRQGVGGPVTDIKVADVPAAAVQVRKRCSATFRRRAWGLIATQAQSLQLIDVPAFRS